VKRSRNNEPGERLAGRRSCARGAWFSAALAAVAGVGALLLLPAAALAHPSGLPRLKAGAETLAASNADWLFWDFHPSIVIGIVVLAVLYTLGIRRWNHDDGVAIPIDHSRKRWMHASFVLLWFFLDGPLHHLADELLFSAHMVQHLALQLVWAPIFVFGLQPFMVRKLLPAGPLRRLVHRITRPGPAFAIYNGTIWIWHIPWLYNLALFSHEWHIVEHLLFMSTAVIFWWPLLSPAPEIPRPAFGSQMMYVFFNMVAMKALGIIISLQDEMIYTYYLQVPRVFGLSPLGDQQVGGLLMWLPGGMLLWGGLGYVFAQWARRGTPKRGTTGIAALDRRRAAAAAATTAAASSGA
jgi:putative membrane protein